MTALVIKLAKEGLSPSLIGARLRDEYGIPLTRPITGKSVSKILMENKIFPAFPPDLQNLLDRSIRVQKNLETFHADRRNVRSLELIEAKIYRLAKYYKRLGVIPNDFKYKTVVAQLA